MLEIFANPGFLAVAGVLISSPIIIHLINRMRFKRVRWAAMEFLLKSQKKNRRKIIIEQLILLLLRILLVLLAAVLFARFLGASTQRGGAGTLHVVVIDDRLKADGSPRAKALHFISDFREGDWNANETEEVTGLFTELTKARNVNVSLIDAGHPDRAGSESSVGAHNNLAVTDLRAESRVC